MLDPHSLDPETFGRLAAHRGAPAYSLFVPTEEKGSEIGKGAIHLKNARADLDRKLEEEDVEAGTRDALIEPLVLAEEDHELWRHQGRGLAVFGEPGSTVAVRLPYPVEAGVHLGDRYRLRPLVDALAGTETPLLALSTREVRLFAATDGSLTQLPYRGPRTIEDANWFQDDESRLQTHPRGGGDSGFHGHDPSDREEEEARIRFLRAVGAAVADQVGPEDTVLVAGVEELVAAYRGVGAHRIHDRLVPGSPDGMTPPQLLERAAPVLDELAADQFDEIARQLDDARSAGRYEEDPAALAQAAAEGRIETAVLTPSAPVIPADDDGTGRIVPAGDGPLDLLDEAIRLTWLNGGKVVSPDRVPGTDAGVAAVLRY